MNNRIIKIVSDETENRTNFPNLSQTDLVDELLRIANKGKIISTKICINSAKEIVTFIDCNSNTTIEIVIDKNLIGLRNKNVEAIRKIAKKVSHTKYVNTGKIGNAIGCLVITATLLTATAVAAYGVGAILCALDAEEYEAHIESINDLYRDKYGFDTRKMIGAEQISPNHYVTTDGIEILKDSEGRFIEIGPYEGSMKR